MKEAGDGWATVCPLDGVPDGQAVNVTLGEEDVLVYRRGDRLFAIGNRCTHQGAQLHEGPIKSFGSIIAVTCPAHGSMFTVNDGRVMRGPAMRPVPAYEVRIREGRVEVRPAAASGADA